MAHPIDTPPFPPGVTQTSLHPGHALVARQQARERSRAQNDVDRRRLVAAYVDVGLANGSGWLAGWIAMQLDGGLVDVERGLVSLATFLVVDLLAPLRPGPRRGQTLGKQLLGLRVVDADGHPPGAWNLLKRGLLRWPAWSLAMRRVIHGQQNHSYLHERWTETKVVRCEPRLVDQRARNGVVGAVAAASPSVLVEPDAGPSTTRPATRTTSSRSGR